MNTKLSPELEELVNLYIDMDTLDPEFREGIRLFADKFVEFPAKAAFQDRVSAFVIECFGKTIAADISERTHRYIEESLELAQSMGCPKEDITMLLDYVYGRPKGEPHQEVGGVMVTLGALCAARGLDMHRDGETELARIYTIIDKLRAKQASRPKGSPLPQPVDNKAKKEKFKDAMHCETVRILRDHFCSDDQANELSDDEIVDLFPDEWAIAMDMATFGSQWQYQDAINIR